MSQRYFKLGSPEAWDFINFVVYDDEVNDPHAHFIVIDDVSTTPPTMAAMAKWNKVKATTEPERFTPDALPANGDPELAALFFAELHNKHVEIMGGREHWYLEMVATKKAYQRNGLGKTLVSWGIERAAEDGLDCYLDSTPEGQRLYEKLGFKTLSTTDFLDGRYTQSFMMLDNKR